MKYSILTRDPYTFRDRNKPKVNPFPSFNKELLKNKKRAKNRHPEFKSEQFGEENSLSTSIEDSTDENLCLFPALVLGGGESREHRLDLWMDEERNGA